MLDHHTSRDVDADESAVIARGLVDGLFGRPVSLGGDLDVRNDHGTSLVFAGSCYHCFTLLADDAFSFAGTEFGGKVFSLLHVVFVFEQSRISLVVFVL